MLCSEVTSQYHGSPTHTHIYIILRIVSRRYSELQDHVCIMFPLSPRINKLSTFSDEELTLATCELSVRSGNTNRFSDFFRSRKFQISVDKRFSLNQLPLFEAIILS